MARQTLVKQKKITPHIPVFDKSTRTDGTFPRVDFTFDPERDRYTCPAGKELVQFRRTSATPRTGITAEGTRLYRASKRDCDVCDLRRATHRNARGSATFAASGGWLTPSEVFAEARGIVSLIKDSAAVSPIVTHRLRNNVSVLEGSGGNIAVLTGPDGKVLVDAGIGVPLAFRSRRRQ